MDVLEAAAELERFKTEVSLAEVAHAYGYELDRRESSRASLVMRRPVDGDKIVIGNEGGHDVFFSVRNDQKNGSEVDFVMQQEGISLGRSHQVLRKWLENPDFIEKAGLDKVASLPEGAKVEVPLDIVMSLLRRICCPCCVSHNARDSASDGWHIHLYCSLSYLCLLLSARAEVGIKHRRVSEWIPAFQVPSSNYNTDRAILETVLYRSFSIPQYQRGKKKRI